MPEFRPPAQFEHEPNPELSSQQQYVQGLWDFVGTIPDLSQFPKYWRPSEEEEDFFSAYCQQRILRPLAERESVPSPHRDDIVDPSFSTSITDILGKATGNSFSYEWYKAKGQKASPYANPGDAYLSRKWEQFYVSYMRERRTFHAQFMTALLSGEPIDEHIFGIGLRDGEPVAIPPVTPRTFQEQPVPSFLYDKDNWLTSSLISALALPPEQCNASMKRRAIELWAQHADLDNAEGIEGFYGTDKLKHVVRLPWSMRNNDDLGVNYHPQWRQNKVVKQYLGEVSRPRADGLSTLLQERPKDYVQVLLLGLFANWGGVAKGLHTLKQAAALSDQVKDIIFADDASFNTIYYDATSDSLSDPVPLATLLEGRMEAVTQEELLQSLSLRVKVLEGELATAQELAAKNGEAAQEWERSYRQLHAAVLSGQVTIHRSQADTLLIKYGIQPGVDNDTLQLLVRAHRRRANRAGHSDVNQDPAALEQTKRTNAELDAILRYRGLANTESRE